MFGTTQVLQSTIAGSANPDKFLRMGQTCIYRKFDPTLINSGSWNEIWIGFRVRLNLAYNWSGSISSSNTISNGNVGLTTRAPYPSDYGQFSIGVFDSRGAPYAGNSATSSIKHSIGVDAYLSTATTLVVMLYQTSSLVQLNFLPQLRCIANGTTSYQAQNTTERMILTTQKDPLFSDYFILRIGTGSSTGSWGAKSICPLSNRLHPSHGTSSAILADMFQKPKFDSLSASLGIEYATYDFSANVPVTRSVNGYFDSLYISWGKSYDFFEISDVVVRAV
jgi:hypothetical protein